MNLNYSEILKLKGKYLKSTRHDSICQVVSATRNNVFIRDLEKQIAGGKIMTSIFKDVHQKDFELATEEEIKKYESNNRKFGFFTFSERNGEREYTHRYITEFKGDENEKGEELAKTWYGSESTPNGEGYEFDGGEVIVTFSTVNLLTEDEYKLMMKFF